MSHELRTPQRHHRLDRDDGLARHASARKRRRSVAARELRRNSPAGLINQVLTCRRSKPGNLNNPQTVQLAPLIEEVIGTARQLAEQNKNRLISNAQENLGALTVDCCGCGDPAQSVSAASSQTGRDHATGAKSPRWSRLGRACRGRHWHRHDCSSTPSCLKNHPGRCLDGEAFRWHRAGLAIARKLARMMGGDVTVTSEPGKGPGLSPPGGAHIDANLPRRTR